MIFKVKKTSEIDLNTSFKVEKSPSFKTENSKNLAQKVQCLKSILFIYPQSDCLSDLYDHHYD